MLSQKMKQIMTLGMSLKGYEQYMSVLLELSKDELKELLFQIEKAMLNDNQRKYEALYGWARFVNDMKFLGYLDQLSWVKQKPEYLKI